ncbi:MAG: hypothetical protein ACOCWZ_09420 [Spirochaetota bacterium]
MARVTYECPECKQIVVLEDPVEKVPEHHGKPMVKIDESGMDICTQPDHPEHARSTAEDDACDDFRGEK